MTKPDKDIFDFSIDSGQLYFVHSGDLNLEIFLESHGGHHHHQGGETKKTSKFGAFFWKWWWWCWWWWWWPPWDSKKISKARLRSPEWTRYNWPESIEKSNLSFTVWPHERSTFWKNMTRNGQNSRPAETDPYIHPFSYAKSKFNRGKRRYGQAGEEEDQYKD